MDLPGCYHLISAMMSALMRENRRAVSSQLKKTRQNKQYESRACLYLYIRNLVHSYRMTSENNYRKGVFPFKYWTSTTSIQVRVITHLKYLMMFVLQWQIGVLLEFLKMLYSFLYIYHIFIEIIKVYMKLFDILQY